jgi:hypothetical protein
MKLDGNLVDRIGRSGPMEEQEEPIHWPDQRKVMYRSRDTRHDVQRKSLSVRYDLRLEAIDPVFAEEVSPDFLERRGRPFPLLDRGVDNKSGGPVIGTSDT